MSTVETAAEFSTWVLNANPKEQLIYYIVNVMRERTENADVNAIANSAYAYFESGKITLRQQRDFKGGSSYVAIRL